MPLSASRPRCPFLCLDYCPVHASAAQKLHHQLHAQAELHSDDRQSHLSHCPRLVQLARKNCSVHMLCSRWRRHRQSVYSSVAHLDTGRSPVGGSADSLHFGSVLLVLASVNTNLRTTLLFFRTKCNRVGDGSTGKRSMTTVVFLFRGVFMGSIFFLFSIKNNTLEINFFYFSSRKHITSINFDFSQNQVRNTAQLLIIDFSFKL